MKTAEEWVTECFNVPFNREKEINKIKEIQLDAYKAGMSEAINLMSDGLVRVIDIKNNKTSI